MILSHVRSVFGKRTSTFSMLKTANPSQFQARSGIFCPEIECDSQRDERQVASQSAPDVNYIVAAPDPKKVGENAGEKASESTMD